MNVYSDEMMAATRREMAQQALLELLDLLETNAIEVWLDGGWAVDALLGVQTRPHEDVDIILAEADVGPLRALLAEDACFHSPVLHRPQQGRELTALYLGAAFQVFAGTDFRYVREIVNDSDACLEFTATIDGIEINGIDLIHWNAEGRISDFKVMIRPWKAIEKIREKMAAMLQSM